jgi:hypothetical protein
MQQKKTKCKLAGIWMWKNFNNHYYVTGSETAQL